MIVLLLINLIKCVLKVKMVFPTALGYGPATLPLHNMMMLVDNSSHDRCILCFTVFFAVNERSVASAKKILPVVIADYQKRFNFLKTRFICAYEKPKKANFLSAL